MNHMVVGSRVRLQTFNGTLQGAGQTRPAENYWLLIGECGTVRGFNAATGRYLVTFDIPVAALGLCCHNPEPNSLYIAAGDLVDLQSGPAV